jgi:hypothetical protein
MKNIANSLLLLTIFLLTGCSSFYYRNDDTVAGLDNKWHPDYEVTYSAKVDNQSSINVGYTDTSKKQIKLKSLKGDWEKKVILKSKKDVKFTVKLKSKKLTDTARIKVKVDGKVLNKYKITRNNSKYTYRFNLL